MGSTVKIGLIADTHIPTRARKLPDRVFEIFNDTDHIIHAGDYVKYSVIEELQKIAPVTGCFGNMDPTILKRKLSKIAILKMDNRVIKVIHDLGWGSHVKELQKEGQVDVIVYGHTHRSSVKKEKDLLLINPGSATNAFLSSSSIGILYLSPDNIDCEIIKLK
ncbi:MAG: metallophosphoesterase family protein [Candidatus Helarchaeota archaeon]|nr:metallophosphoesterase family protein [Candidatus Helarchaeota archaeon]